MKNLLLLFFLIVGLGSTSQAQNDLVILLDNQSSDTWVVSLNDAGPSGIYNTSLAPTGSATSTMSKFQLGLKYKIMSSSGCKAFGSITSTTPPATGGIISTSCPGVDIIYTLTNQPNPKLYKLKMLFN